MVNELSFCKSDQGGMLLHPRHENLKWPRMHPTSTVLNVKVILAALLRDAARHQKPCFV
jgi:hypothetical protein